MSSQPHTLLGTGNLPSGSGSDPKNPKYRTVCVKRKLVKEREGSVFLLHRNVSKLC